jgi:hypothetical protein
MEPLISYQVSETDTNTESEKAPFPISRVCWPQTGNPIENEGMVRAAALQETISSERTSAVEEKGESKSNAKTRETTKEPIVSSPPVLPSMNANPEDKTVQNSKTNDKESSKTVTGASKVFFTQVPKYKALLPNEGKKRNVPPIFTKDEMLGSLITKRKQARTHDSSRCIYYALHEEARVKGALEILF